MPEGHTIHRAAREQCRLLGGQVLAVSSPQGRFTEGAARLDGRRCLIVEAYGKHLIYRFEGQEALHLHLGLFGRIRKRKLPLTEPRGAVRVRLVGTTHVVDVNGPNICEVLDEQAVASRLQRLGPDVLRPDADPERAFRRISRSRASIGRLILDQSVMAGIGNIYRTEILWRQAIHPETPGRAIDRIAFERIWRDAVELLEIGVRRNSIVTVANPPSGRGRFRERVNIFGKQTCPKCKGPIRRFELDARRAYVCEACQPVQT
ncbi:MAG: DNA-formamidopyrimidine glycosylase family protein [Kiloniellales bacterium]|nr:DNA-formamidopyrimidine glycosylase family protein [Kiloniellales bacterium]